MRRLNQLIFDEVISALAGIDVYYYTSDSLSALLGLYDQIGLQAVTDDAIGGVITQIEISIETSCDGRHWARKNAAPEIPLTTVSQTGTTVLPYGNDNGSLPSYAFVRLFIRLVTRNAGSVHLKVYVTGRDQGGVVIRVPKISEFHPTPYSPNVKPSKPHVEE
jgi:hypothetical protein